MRYVILSFFCFSLGIAKAQTLYRAVERSQLALVDLRGLPVDTNLLQRGTELALLDGNACLRCLANMDTAHLDQLLLVTAWSEKRRANFAISRLVKDRYGQELYFVKRPCQDYQGGQFCFGKDIGPLFLRLTDGD